MTEETTAQAAEPKLAPTSQAAEAARPSNPTRLPPAALAIHTSLKDQYKNLTLERIADDLTRTLETPGHKRTTLSKQVQVLDSLFNEMLIDTPRDLHHLPLINMALKAQRQCQVTAASISNQKKLDKQTNSSRNPWTDFMNAKI